MTALKRMVEERRSERSRKCYEMCIQIQRYMKRCIHRWRWHGGIVSYVWMFRFGVKSFRAARELVCQDAIAVRLCSSSGLIPI